MGMASAARQQQMQPQQQQQQRPQLGGGKGQPAATQQPNPIAAQTGGMGQTGSGMSLADFANKPKSMPPQLGGGKGQPVGLGQAGLSPQQANNLGQQLAGGQQPAYPFPQQPSPLGAAMGGLGGGKGQPSQMGGMSDLQRLAPNMQGDGASYQDYVNRPTQEMKMSEEQFNAQRGGMPQYGIPEQQGGSYNRGNVPQYAQDLYQQLQGQQFARQPAPNEYSVARQPMLQPAVQPSQMPQMNQEQMLHQYQTMLRGAPAPVAQPVAAAPKPFVSQPVVKESPRQAQQRKLQQLANVKRFGIR
jgi:hypothetical protein